MSENEQSMNREFRAGQSARDDESGPDLAAARAVQEKLYAVIRGALVKSGATDAAHELEKRRQRGGQ